MKLEETTYPEAVKTHRPEVFEKLKTNTPRHVVAILEKKGWSREWACQIVAGIERKRNPAGLMNGSDENQRLRKKYVLRAMLGGVFFLIGLLVTIGTLVISFAQGGIAIIAYGAIIWGGITFWSAYPNISRYPDREIPVYHPPKAKGHNPQDY
ncbi:MAG: hypothetical protein ACSHYB_04665 [Roseibacillus sp.]